MAFSGIKEKECIGGVVRYTTRENILCIQNISQIASFSKINNLCVSRKCCFAILCINSANLVSFSLKKFVANKIIHV